MKTLTTLLIAGTAGVGVLSTAGLALASPASPSTTGSHHSHHQLLTAQQRQTLRRTGHVELLKHTRKRGVVTVEVQRGAISALTPSSITLLSKNGYSHSYLLTPATIVREKGQQESVSDLTAGERVMVVAIHGPSGDVVRRIACIRPAANAPAAPTPAT